MATKNGLSQRLQDVKAKRLIRVFISSTFRDMIEDRNELMSQCWPQLRALCRKRQVELSEIDLRWGISEAQSERKETLKLCLDEIQACRPFFLGLLGERYGWVPDSSALTQDLLQEQSWLKGIADTSVTELEILHGVLRDPGMSDRTFFYFRDPAYAQARGGDFLSETESLGKKQADLKERIRQTCSAKGIFLHETYSDPQELAQLVLEQFTKVIEELFPENEIPDPLDKEATEHEAFAASRRLTYIGRDAYYAALDSHASGDGKPLIFTGASGGGKSALLANWVQHWRKEHPEDIIFQHYIGGTADSSNHWKLLRRLLSEIKRQTGDESEIPRDNDELRRDLQLWLSKARLWAEKSGKRFIIILDALNQLEDTDHAQLLGWLPDEPFRCALRLIGSSLEGTCLESLKPRNWNYLPVNPLQPEEKAKLIKQYLKRFGKELDDTNTQTIVSAPQSENPLYLKILLDELRVTGTFEGLSERIRLYLKEKDIPHLLHEVLLRWQTDYERDRPGLVKDALSFVFAARRGLSESELLELLHQEGLTKLPMAIWSPLRAALDESLVERGGIMSFAHDYLRTAVQGLFLLDLDTLDDIRLFLADYFEGLERSTRSCDELPWLLNTTESFQRLQRCLLDIERFLLIFKRDKNELQRYWVDMKAQSIMGREYPSAFTAWEANTKPRVYLVSYAANQLALFLKNIGLYTTAEPLYRRALEITESVCGAKHPQVAMVLQNLAQLLQATNRLAEAEPLMRRTLAIDEASNGQEHPSVARDLNNLAQLLQATNHLSEAESLMLRSVRITEVIYGVEHPEVALVLNNLGGLFQITNRLAEGEEIYRRSLEIIERNMGTRHPHFATSLSNLAGLLFTTNQLSEALSLMRQALEISEDIFGTEHPNVARDCNNLAKMLQDLNQFDEANFLYLRALRIYDILHWSKHPQYGITLGNLAGLLYQTNHMQEAESLMRQALEISEANHGHNHPSVAVSLSDLGILLHTTNRFEESESILRRALKINEDHYGLNHPTVARVLNNIASLLHDTNHFDEAEYHYKRALEIYEMSYEKDSANIAKVLNNLAQLLQATNRLSEAEPLLQRVIEIDEKSYGCEHPEVALDLNNLAYLQHIMNRDNEAESLLRKSVKILVKYTQHTGEKHPRMPMILNNYHDLLLTMGFAQDQAIERLFEIAPELFPKG